MSKGFLDFLKRTRPNAGSAVLQSKSTFFDPNTGDQLGGNKKLTSQKIYPSDLFTPGVEPYILFFIRDGVARSAEIKEKIALYMPRSLVVNYGAQYQEIEMTLYQYADLGGDLAKVLGAKSIEEFTALGKNVLGTLASRSLANVIDYEAGSNFGQQIEAIERDMTVNPHMGLLFKGVDFRTFTFRFQMMARNKAESEAITTIIKAFKLGMHPGKSSAKGARYWTYPDNFDIGLFTPGHGHLFNLSTCVLTNMRVDYAGSEIPSFFDETGAPVDIRMDLTFKELEVLTKDRIEEGY